MIDVSVYAAFLAGVVSFLSPCVLPLVPGYVSMLSGIGVEQLKEGGAGFRARVFDCFYHVWSIGECGWFLPGAQSHAAGADRRLADCALRPTPDGLASEDQR